MTDDAAEGLVQFDWQAFRHLQTGRIEPGAHLNVIHGRNAAGKTSLLESIHFLARARSFLTHRSAQLIHREARQVTVSGRIRVTGSEHRLGIQHGEGETRVRLNGQDIHALSESAWLLPIQVINTEAQRLLTDSPEVRRAFLNWGVFHVEPSYRSLWRRYQKALRQRNAALRAGDLKLASAWEPEMAVAAEAVHEKRATFLQTVLTASLGIAEQWLPNVSLNWRYRPGWPAEESLEAVLKSSREREVTQGFSLYGPHRADFKMIADGIEAEKILSRGQQKLLVAAMRLALVEYWGSTSQPRPLILIDDLPAELDAQHRQDLIQRLQTVSAQVFVTAIEAEQLPELTNASWFHVEHGVIKPG